MKMWNMVAKDPFSPTGILVLSMNYIYRNYNIFTTTNFL